MNDNIKLEILRQESREPLRLFAQKVIAALGDNLRSITVVGSSLTGDFLPGQSDINTVLVLEKVSLSALNNLGRLGKQMAKKKVSAPLLMTGQYIARSLDVFSIEFLNFQFVHQTIYGENPFESLSIAKAHVRLQCERELKAMLIRLRQGYIASAGNRKLIRDVIISASKGLAPLLRAMLWLKDIEAPKEAEATFAKAGESFSIAPDMLIAAKKWQHKKTRLGDSEADSAFESMYSAVEQLALIVDKLEV